MIVVFTDLDGTLLDSETYSFEPVLPVLDRMKAKSVPLVLCSSKTRAEMVVIHQRLSLSSPFIVENGSAVLFPGESGSMETIVLGLPVSDVRDRLKKAALTLGIEYNGFGEMSADDIVELTGLTKDEAILAGQREYSEPFILLEETPEDIMRRFIEDLEKAGLQYTRGGRFHHAMGPTDKGRAVKKVIARYEKTSGESVTSIALGDSPNDLPMLEAVDKPVLVQRPDGSYMPYPEALNPILAQGIGPVGWAHAVGELLGG